ncbi:hypothetical protein [Mycobacterium tuberculosis]|uniref:hypothetical protein n=1 Tax=Mycobacterium tuberculosis TaxID=1773 RepID=UPI00214F34C7|nr:hypothetical protein [Mycobacterium tuberculosis]
MPGLGQIALNSAPIFGGAMLAIAAGQFKGPDFRALIRQDMDLNRPGESGDSLI